MTPAKKKDATDSTNKDTVQEESQTNPKSATQESREPEPAPQADAQRPAARQSGSGNASVTNDAKRNLGPGELGNILSPDPSVDLTETPLKREGILINFDTESFLKNIVGITARLDSVYRLYSNESILALLDTQLPDMPKMGFPRTRLRTGTHEQTPYIQHGIDDSESLDFFDSTGIAGPLVNRIHKRFVEEGYMTLVNVDSEVVNGIKVWNPAKFGLDWRSIDFRNETIDMNEFIKQFQIRTKGGNVREVAALMLPEEAYLWDMVQEEIFNQTYVTASLERRRLFETHYAYEPAFIPSRQYNHNEIEIGSATGYNSQMYHIEGMTPFLLATSISFFPEMKMMNVYSNSEAKTLAIRAGAQNIATQYLEITPNNTHFTDIQNIIASLVLKGAIVLTLPRNVNTVAGALSALFCRLFCSVYSPEHGAFGNLMFEDALETDTIIAKNLIEPIGPYVRRSDAVSPLDLDKVTSRGTFERSGFMALATTEDNVIDGWLSKSGFIYDKKGTMPYKHAYTYPSYGNYPLSNDPNKEVQRLEPPPIFLLLRKLFSARVRELAVISQILAMRAGPIIEFFSVINTISHGSQNSFRPTVSAIHRMGTTSQPTIVPIQDITSFLVLVKHMVTSLTPNPHVLSIPVIEAQIETQLSMLSTTYNTVTTVAQMNHISKYVNKKIALEETAKILGSPFISLIAHTTLDSLNFYSFNDVTFSAFTTNSPYANAYRRYMQYLIQDPEPMGYTRNLVWKRHKSIRFRGDPASLVHNDVIIRPDCAGWDTAVVFSADKMLEMVNNGCLVSDWLNANDGKSTDKLLAADFLVPFKIVVSGEIMEQKESIVLKFTTDSVGPNTYEDVTFLPYEDIYIIPQKIRPSFRDYNQPLKDIVISHVVGLRQRVMALKSVNLNKSIFRFKIKDLTALTLVTRNLSQERDFYTYQEKYTY